MFRASATLVLALLIGLAPAGCGRGIEDQLAAARAQQDDGQFEESIEPLRQVLGEDPENAEANYLLGYALIRTGRVGPAVWPLRKAAQSEEFGDTAGQLLTFALLNTGNFDEARSVADELLAKKPGDTAVLRLRAQANLDGRRYEEMLADADQILAAEPGDIQAQQLRAVALTELKRWDEAEAIFQQMREQATQAGDVTIAGRACVALASLSEKRGDAGKAEQTFAGCADSYSSDPLILGEVAGFYVRKGEPDKATAIWRTAVERAPDSLALRLGLGRRLYESGDMDGAKKVVEQAANDFASAQAWETLAELNRASGDFKAADQYLQKALETGSDSERLRYKRADTLVDAGDFEAAEAAAAEFQESAFRDLIHGRVLLQQGDPKGALEALEAGLARWPDNAPARAAAGRAAQEIGDTKRAFEHYRHAIRADGKGTDAAYAAALLARALGRPQEAAEYARYQLANRPMPNDQGPLLLAIEASREAGNQEQAEGFRNLLAKRAQSGDPGAVAALARLVQQSSGPEAAITAIDAVKLDLTQPKNEPVLRMRVDAQVQLGQAKQALAAVDRALAKHPEEPALLDLRGRVLAALGRKDEARASFEQALAADPQYAPSHAGLGSLAVQAGDLPTALQQFDAAVAADPADPESAHRAAQIVLAQGNREDAEKRLRALLIRTPVHAGACNDLAWILAEEGRDLDLALDLAQRAVRLAPTPSPDFVDTLAYVQLARGEAADAVATLEPALQQHPDSGLLRYRLGLAQEKLGDKDAALAAFREALQDGSFSDAEQARARIARLEAGSGAR
jgi:tetratricopeptide (TPR) repeat protein